MKDITLQQLLEAGCHFGHKSERRHPKASSYIYTEKDGIHIIDLAKTKEGLDAACQYVQSVALEGGEVLFVGTKRQAKDIVCEEAKRVGASFITERWIGGFLTNWEGIQQTIKKILTMTEDEASGAWKKFPKHEQFKLAHHLKRLNVFYGGVTKLSKEPQVLFLADIKKENVAFREALRCGIPIVAIVDTNINPTDIQYPIPANDDAVGSISIITKAIADAYLEGKREFEKQKEAILSVQPKNSVEKEEKQEMPTPEVKTEGKKKSSSGKKAVKGTEKI